MKHLHPHLPKINVWLSAKDAGAKISMSRDTIENRGIPWQESPVTHYVRYKMLQLDAGGKQVRRYFEPDVEALLIAPPTPGRRKLILQPDFQP